MDAWFLQVRKALKPLRRLKGPIDAETTLDRLVRESAPDEGSEPPAFTAAFIFTLTLARALSSIGLPAQRLEEALQRLGASFGHRVESVSTPLSLVLTYSDGTHWRTRVLRVEPTETDLERLSALHALIGRVERGEISPADGTRRVRAILERPSRHGAFILVLAHGLASAAAAILLGGGLADVLPALVLGALVGGLGRAAHALPTLGRIYPALATFALTLAVRWLASTGLAVHEPVLVLASVVVLLPGFTLTVATTELATAHVVSGTARMMGAMSTLLQLGFGVAVGHRVAAYLPLLDVPAPPPPEIVGWMQFGAYATAALAFMTLLRAAPKDTPAVLIGAALAVIGAQLGRAWLGPEVGAFLGALAIGLASHLYARWRDRPVLLLLTPGILMLVPGSVGFLSIASMLAGDLPTALETGFRMILIAVSLAAGVLLATVALPPRHAL